jgi:MFS family permease
VGADVPAAPAPHLSARVAALGIAQIVSWGTLFYTIAVLGAPMRADLGVSDAILFGGFSAGLLLSGAASPSIGRWIDAGHARFALAGGSCVGALACALLATVQGPVSLCLAWLVAGAAMALTLYDPAFATLHTMSGARYRRAVTALTLFGGFASTVFWPLSLALSEAAGWRAAFWVFAALHLALCLPLHLAAIPRAVGVAPASAAPDPAMRLAGDERSRGRTAAPFFWLALALSGAAFAAAAVSAHAIGLLTAAGLTAADAVLAGTLVGPLQVAGRIVEFTVWRRLSARAVGAIAFTLLALGLATLILIRGLPAAAFAFTVTYGFANGLITIARGTVPAELFGRHAFGALLGRLAQPQLYARAVAPLALALVFPFDPERRATPWLLAALGLAALVAYAQALRARRAETGA